MGPISAPPAPQPSALGFTCGAGIIGRAVVDDAEVHPATMIDRAREMTRHGLTLGKDRDAAAGLRYPDSCRHCAAMQCPSTSRANAWRIREWDCENAGPRRDGSTMLHIATSLLALTVLSSAAAIVVFSRSAAAARWIVLLANGAAVLAALEIVFSNELDGVANWAFLFACGACGCGVVAVRNLDHRPMRWIHRFVIYAGYAATFAAMGAAGLELHARDAGEARRGGLHSDLRCRLYVHFRGEDADRPPSTKNDAGIPSIARRRSPGLGVSCCKTGAAESHCTTTRLGCVALAMPVFFCIRHTACAVR